MERHLELCLNKRCNPHHFDEIMIGRHTCITFNRTLRIPEDGKTYPLPAGLGRLPLHRVEDYASRVPRQWLEEGGFFVPLYQKEALFLQFSGPKWHPTIAKVCVGMINAVSGKKYSENILSSPQDYVVIPDQKWLDGINSGTGLVRQFVAMPLGKGYTIEAQVTDEEKHGGFQIVIFDAAEGRFPDRDPETDERIRMLDAAYSSPLGSAPAHSASGETYSLSLKASPVMEMGIAAGGNIKQLIYPDMYGIDSWDMNFKRVIKIHLINSVAYKKITGAEPPPSPITIEQYQNAGIPWYSHYDETVPSVKAPSVFKRILGIIAIEKRRGDSAQMQPAIEIDANLIRIIRTPSTREASEAYRIRARESANAKRWKSALQEISYVIDLKQHVKSDDYSLRSQCNFNLKCFQEGAIDGSLAIEMNSGCVEALTWRARCRKELGDHEGLRDDAERLIKTMEAEVLGLELKAEASLLSGRYNDAVYDALYLKKKYPRNERAEQILDEARIKANEQFKARKTTK